MNHLDGSFEVAGAQIIPNSSIVKGNPAEFKIPESIKTEERIDGIFGDFIGKMFLGKKIIDVTYMTKTGEKVEFRIDIENNTFIYNERKYHIDTINGLSIAEIIFTKNTLEIKGSLGDFHGTLYASYQDILKEMDKIYDHLQTSEK